MLRRKMLRRVNLAAAAFALVATFCVLAFAVAAALALPLAAHGCEKAWLTQLALHVATITVCVCMVDPCSLSRIS